VYIGESEAAKVRRVDPNAIGPYRDDHRTAVRDVGDCLRLAQLHCADRVGHRQLPALPYCLGAATRRFTRTSPEGRQTFTTIDDVGRVRVKRLALLRRGAMTQLRTLLQVVFPEFEAVFPLLAKKTPLILLRAFPTPAELLGAPKAKGLRMLHTASRGTWGRRRMIAW
jgi:hypothetical protein